GTRSDLSSASDSIRRTATIFGATATALILVTVVVGALTSFYVTRRESQKVLQPIEELGAWLDRVAKSDLEHDLGNQYAVTRELGVVNDNFKNLLTAIRFGNSAITLAGHLSNLGVLYKDLDVDERVARRGKAGEEGTVPLTANQQKAVELSTRARELHRGVDNIEGIAQTSGNFGQLYLDVNDYARAETLIRDAYDMVRRSGERAPATEAGTIAMQYACMNMGYLADRMGKPVEAVTWYTYVLQRFAVVVAFVQRTCAAELVRICEEPGDAFRPELAKVVREVGAQLFGELASVPQGSKAAARAGRSPEGQLRTFARAAKNVWFVLDVSGSRGGGTGDARRVNWVVALTDGGDNSSGIGDLERARKLLRENPGFGLIIITVGSLPKVAQIQSLLDAVSAGPGRAVLIGADASGEAIKSAFGKVVRVLGGALVVESL
ncbi:hypothetical protein HK405_011326, partial [Cladochytrium tenue]